MNENYDDCHHQKTTRTFIYTKSKKIAKRFYIQKAIHLKKTRKFPLCLYIQKGIHLTLRDFHEVFEVGIYI